MNNIEDTAPRDRAADLLRRYASLDPTETEELIRFLAAGPIVDRGMVKGDETLAPIVAQVVADHPAPFRVGIGRQIVITLAVTLPFLALCYLAWGAGAT